MRRKITGSGIFAAFVVISLAAFFCSDLILREASVASVKRDPKRTDVILASLPSFARARIKSKVELLFLRKAVDNAHSDREKIIALTSLAFYLKGTDEEGDCFSKITDLPSMPESINAYCYFLENKDTHKKISVPEFCSFVMASPTQLRPSFWQQGLSVLLGRNIDDKVLTDYFSFLLSYEPDYFDYTALYAAISDYSLKIQNQKMMNAAHAMIDKCKLLPSLEEEGKKEMTKNKQK